jgi:hypothetical protein
MLFFVLTLNARASNFGTCRRNFLKKPNKSFYRIPKRQTSITNPVRQRHGCMKTLLIISFILILLKLAYLTTLYQHLDTPCVDFWYNIPTIEAMFQILKSLSFFVLSAFHSKLYLTVAQLPLLLCCTINV